MATQDDNNAVRVFSARACAEPLERAAALFTEKTGVKVEIDVCSRHCASGVAEEASGEGKHDDFLDEISEAGVHDLAIGGAEYLLDDGEVRGIVQKGERRTIAARESAIIVPAGNPAGIETVRDLAKPGVRVAISMIDCLKGLWEDVCGRLGLIEGVLQNISYRANGCVAIVEAVAQRKVDAGVGWTAFEHLAPGRIEAVRLPESARILRGTGIGLLRFSRQPDAAKKFMDFLTTPEARAFYLDLGWVAPTGGRA